MKNFNPRLFFLLGLFVSTSSHFGTVFAQNTAHDLLVEMDQVLRGKNSHSMTVQMDVKTPRWQRSYNIDVKMKGVNHAFARVKSPAKVEGQGFLRIESRLWNYLPTAERTMLIPPSLMLDKFLGSDFTNDDFVKLTYFPRDYKSTLLDENPLGGIPSYHLELFPHPDAPVTYGKIEMWIDKEKRVPLRWLFFDDKLKPIRQLDYSEVKSFGDHSVPTVWTMANLEKPEHQTIIKILNAEYDVEIEDETFVKDRLEKYP